ncbi:putative polyketide synthase [Roridomyces roridus]|uniref:Polyketide synthase n=1 Tax=Roridomyces roridus TaxID=1738132 RepID=A0AAD7FQQ7_9AGAR|nr:putative polyketide synthase [Roridomyces roridus]
MSLPIAIVGISADLPSGTSSDTNYDHASFYEFLLASGESYERIPAGRLDIETWRGYGLGRISVETGSFLKDIDEFDHVEFGISSRDARAMAPASRKLLEQCFLALLDSGIDYRKQHIGCYTSGNSIELSNVASPDEYEPRGSFAGAPSMLANRVSTHLDLVGPSIPVDTACSSSQTALHVAVQAILSGDCRAAVVGGCQLNHRLMDWIGYSQTSVLSPDGKCKPFDAGADGFGRAEGCVAVVLKPLQDALNDHDHVYATILGTAVNSTGSSGPPGAPVAESQCDAMKIAFKRAGVEPSDVAYVELHATGTSKGDPTEANWVGKHFKREEELLVGSVKGNIGHTEITAFLASLSKVVSIFEHGVIPPNVNVSTLNPAIKWREYNLRVPLEPTRLPSGRSGRTLISMSSSGIGGSNGHVVLEAPPPPGPLDQTTAPPEGSPVLLMAAGLSPRSASTVAEQLTELFKTGSEHRALSTVLCRRSKQMSWRSFAVVDPAQKTPVQFSSPQYSSRDVNPLVFVFSGQGPQHEAMGREMFKIFPVFRESIQEMDLVFQRKTGKSIINDYGLFDCVPSSFEYPTVWPIALTLPSIAMFQIALFDLLIHLGIQPDIVLGHSAGETAVLYASGAAPKAMAVELAIIRGQIFSTLENSGGTMVALSCTGPQAEDLLARYGATCPGARVEIACLNASSAIALAGEERAIDGILDMAQRDGIFARKIRTRVPIHSSMMDVCRDRYRAEVQDLFARYPGDHMPKIRTYSTLTGDALAGPLDAEYFWMNTRSQVVFAPTIQKLNGVASTFVELTPHPVLSSYLSDMTTSSSSTILSIVRRPKTGAPSTEYRDTLQFLGKLTAAGHNCVDFTTLNAATCSQARTAAIPAYPFLKKRFPLFPDSAQNPEPYYGPLNHSRLKLSRDTHPTLSEHVIRGEPIWPAAGFVEMALEFGATTLLNVNFRGMLPLSSEAPFPVEVSLDGSFWQVSSSIPKTGDVQNSTHRYPSSHRTVQSSSVPRDKFFIIHPAILDAAFQITAYRPFHGDFAPNNYYLPSSIGEVILHKPSKLNYLPSHVYAHVELLAWRPDSLQFNIAVVDGRGQRLCTLQNFVVAKHHLSPVQAISLPLHPVAQRVFNRPRQPDSPLTPPLDKSEFFAFDIATQDLRLATALTTCCSRLRNAIMSLSPNNSQRAIRICISTEVDAIISRVAEIAAEFPHVAFEVSIPNSRTPPTHADDEFFVIRRHADGLPRDRFFDIVLSFGRAASNVEAEPASLINLCNDILLPGGTLILADLNRTSWDQQVSGTGWYTATFGAPHAFPLDEYRAGFEQAGYTVVHSDYSPVSDPFFCTLDAQKAAWDPEKTVRSDRLEDVAFVFDYVVGDELFLQWELSGLNPAQDLEIWILATEGPNAAAGMCMTRALRREYLFWRFKFVSFPAAFSNTVRMDLLQTLPDCLRAEPDIIFSAQGDLFVQRLVPILAPKQQMQTRTSLPFALIPDLQPDHGLALVSWASSFPGFSVVAGSLVQVNSDSSLYRAGVTVLGLQNSTSEGHAVIDLGPTCVLHSDVTLSQSVVDSVPGTVVALLAPGLSTWNRTHRIKSLSILITHSDSPVGETVSSIYSQHGLRFSQTAADVSMLDLARLAPGFDLIISSYDDNTHIPILQTLLKPAGGKLFLWNRELPRILREDPCSIGDILRLAASRNLSPIADLVVTEGEDIKCPLAVAPAVPVPMNGIYGAVFDPEKTYVILGGIGSLGASVAVYMAERGARHLVVTSRSGRGTLAQDKNLIARRIFRYLEDLEYLDIDLQAVDGSSADSMRALFGSITRPLGGCLILSGILRDGLFPTLGDDEFTSVAASKTGVLKTLQHTIDVSRLEFLIAFSSVTSIVGTGGQTNYCAANGALEEQVAVLPNGFSFICPGILDSAFMLAEGSNGSRLKHLLDWSISTDEMMLWVDDSIRKYQNGGRFQRYMPRLDWETLDRTHGMPRLGTHLVHAYTETNAVETEPVGVRAGRIIQNVLNISKDDFDDDVPLTSYGVDSLSAGRLSFALRSIVEVTQLQLLADNSLNDILRKFASEAGPEPVAAERSGGVEVKKINSDTLMDDLVRKFVDRLDALSVSPQRPRLEAQPATQTVLLTGTTGALGCHLLANLLENDEIHQVYALNRGESLVERQAAAFAKQGLDTALAQSSKLILLSADLDRDDWGVSSETMSELRSSVTHIIHNAWKVDFMARLGDFENLILATYRLLEFAIKSTRPIAAEKQYLNANVIRVGQLTGSASGSWDTSQWVSALAQSGAHVGCLPEGNDTVSWIPIVTAAAAVVDMRHPTAMDDTYHLVHPKPTTWNAIMEPMASMLDVPLVPYREWYARLKAADGDITALRLLDYFHLGLKTHMNRESMGLLPKVVSSKGSRASETLINTTRSLGADDVRSWVEYWRGIGYLPRN